MSSSRALVAEFRESLRRTVGFDSLSYLLYGAAALCRLRPRIPVMAILRNPLSRQRIMIPTDTDHLHHVVTMHRQVCEDYFSVPAVRPGPGHVVIDAGANIGIYSIIAAQCGAEVHSFEPFPWAAQHLRRNVERNGLDVRIVAKPLGTGDQRRMFSLYRATQATFSPSFPSHKMPVGTERVRTLTLDGYCLERGIGRVDLLKLDVEGMEFDVLSASEKTLQVTSAMMVEWHSYELRSMVEKASIGAGLDLATRREGGTGWGVDYYLRSTRRR